MNDYKIIINILDRVINQKKSLNEVYFAIISKETIDNQSKIKDISYGVCRNYYRLITIFNILVKKQSEEKITLLLLIGIYEILYSKKKVYAITNDLVALAFIISNSDFVKNFVNAVLRNFIRTKENIIDEASKNDQYKYNISQWLLLTLRKQYPLNYLKILSSFDLIPKITLRINPRKTSKDAYLHLLDDNNILYEVIDNKIVILDNIRISNLPFFNEGYVSIQDNNAQKLIDLIEFNKNDYVLDACSAPGGKLTQLLENYDINILAIDNSFERLKMVEQNLKRLDLKAIIKEGDASNLKWWDKKYFDKIIADLPCSATGTIKRNPDIKINKLESDINKYVKLQQEIIINLWSTLKSGGFLIYITCSILKEENQDNILKLKKKLANLKIIKEIQLLPDKISDGFYYCILQKM